MTSTIQATLGSKFNIMAIQNRDGEEVRIEGQTKQGKKFAFILQKQKSDVGERTVIAFEGEKEANDLLWDAVFTAMTPGPRPQVQRLPQNSRKVICPGRLSSPRIVSRSPTGPSSSRAISALPPLR